ncbi:PSMC3 interacting protein [Coemansia sp. BCRC 34490]|nr:PSMC3 interacting protein [Coemansia sp. BCRC 34490]
MPAKKSKGVSEEESAVLDYLVKANRPYSANDISSQLHGKVSPNQAKKILNDLADDGRIQRKANGKQQIFYANQSDIEVPSIEEAEEEEEKIKELEERVDALKSNNKSLAGRLQGLNSALTDDQMRERISKLSNEENDERLEHLRSGEVISPEEKAKIETEHAAMLKHWKARKRMFKNISDAISENYPGKMKDLFADIGVETDEDVGADTAIIAAK